VRWLKAKKAARLLDCDPITVKRRRTPYLDQGIQGRIRFKHLVLDEHAKPRPRFLLEDVTALLKCPIPHEELLYTPIYTAARPEARFHDPDRENTRELGSMMRVVTATEYLDLSRDAIEDRLIEWADEYVPFRIRRIDPEEHGLGYPLCYSPDVEALLQDPRQPEPVGGSSRFHIGV
jgi:hypothetical protein